MVLWSQLAANPLYDHITLACVPSVFRPGWVLAGLVLFGVGFGLSRRSSWSISAGPAPISRQSGRTSSDGVFPLFTLEQLDLADPVAGR